MAPGRFLVACAAALVVPAASCESDCHRTGSTPSPSKTSQHIQKPDSSPRSQQTGLAAVSEPTLEQVATFHGELARATFLDARERARRLAMVIGVFKDAPTPDRLDAARQAWLAALDPARQCLVYFTSDRDAARETPDGGRDSDTPFREALRLELEAADRPESNALPDRDALAHQHWSGSGRPLRGLRTMELLLWGPREIDGEPRGHTAYETSQGTSQETMRLRRSTLQVASKYLAVEDLAGGTSDWRSEGPRRRELTKHPRESLREIADSMHALAERLAVELERPLERREPKLAPHPYAQVSRRSFRATALGLQNVYRGRYLRTDNSKLEGPGLSRVVEAVDPKLDERLSRQIETVLERVQAIPRPYVTSLRSEEGRAAIRTAVDAVDALKSTLSELRNELEGP